MLTVFKYLFATVSFLLSVLCLYLVGDRLYYMYSYPSIRTTSIDWIIWLSVMAIVIFWVCLNISMYKWAYLLDKRRIAKMEAQREENSIFNKPFSAVTLDMSFQQIPILGSRSNSGGLVKLCREVSDKYYSYKRLEGFDAETLRAKVLPELELINSIANQYHVDGTIRHDFIEDALREAVSELDALLDDFRDSTLTGFKQDVANYLTKKKLQ